MLLRNISFFVIANSYAQIIRLGQELAVRLLMTPEIVGIWSLILVIYNFGATFDSGILSAAFRKIPLLHGAGDEQQANEYKQVALILHIFIKILVALGIVVYVLINYQQQDMLVFWGGIAAALMVVFAGTGEALMSFYQMAQRYVELSKLLVIYWSCYAFFVALGLYLANISGLIIATTLAYLLQIIIFSRFTTTKQHQNTLKWSYEKAKELLKFAIPFRIVDYPMSLAITLDSLFVARYFSLELLAIYMTAKIVANQLGQLPTWVGNVFIVRMTTLTAQTSNDQAIVAKDLYRNLMVMYLIILPIIISLSTLAMKIGVDLILEEYLSAVTFLPLLLVTLYFHPRVTIIRNIWIIGKNYNYLLASNLVVLLLMVVGFIFLLVQNKASLVNVTIIMAMSFFVYFIVVIILLYGKLFSITQSISIVFHAILGSGIVLLALHSGNLFSLQYTAITIDYLLALSHIMYWIIPLILYALLKLNWMSKTGA